MIKQNYHKKQAEQKTVQKSIDDILSGAGFEKTKLKVPYIFRWEEVKLPFADFSNVHGVVLNGVPFQRKDIPDYLFKIRAKRPSCSKHCYTCEYLKLEDMTCGNSKKFKEK